MKKFDLIAYQKMVRDHQDRDDPLGWFDSIYQDAEGDHKAVFWADLAPSPDLLGWLNKNSVNHSKKAIAIGCGVGDDAEALAINGYQVTAFDIAPHAIKLCKKRYPQSKVHYLVENLFDYPQPWKHHYDLVYECNTIQVLPGEYRKKAMKAMADLLKKDGDILVSCRSRIVGEQLDDIPLPLDQNEISYFKELGLSEQSFSAYDDKQVPAVPHFFATYKNNTN
jgi:2-polyprenyl-3-methyl-5-hydroxy-6-metoxy-1,4-benzoquinol methylase